jgi:hypothetical protein
MNCELRQGMSGAALAAIIAVAVICAGSLFAVSNEMAAGTSTVTSTYTTTLFRTGSGHTSTVLVPTTVTETSTSPPNLTPPTTTTTTSIVLQTPANTTTETTTVTTVQTVTQTMNSTTPITTTTGSTSSSSPQTFQLAVSYSVANETACQPDPYVQCTWSGIISWSTSACDFAYACQGLQISPQPNDGAYPFTLGECGIAVNWTLSMNTPSGQSQLSVTITNAQGTVVYQASTSPTTWSLSGSYSPC